MGVILPECLGIYQRPSSSEGPFHMKAEQMGPKMTVTIKRFYEDPDFPDQGTFDYPDYPANKLEDHLRPDRLEEDRYIIHETSYEVFEGNPSVAHGNSYKLKKRIRRV
ncbi:hypothetical protein BKA60DRAFT_535011 [Fusarium oxysporum]|nr:hypothetical protein BKA60DRAFT_535011 [Fusarium oxysporum]